MQFAVYISDTPVTLQKSQGHQPYNYNADPKIGHNHAHLERSFCNGVREKANVNSFWNEEICQLSALNRYENEN